MKVRHNLIRRSLALSTLTMMLIALSTWAQNIPNCDNKMWIPDGSVATTDTDGSISIETPRNYAYVGYNLDGAIAVFSDASKCSCTCTKNAGTCSPSIFNDNCSCTAKDGCTACSLSTTAAATDQPYELGGYVDLAAGVSFVTVDDTDLPAAFPALFDLPEVLEAVQSFVNNIYQGARVPELEDHGDYATAAEGYTLAAVSIFGRVALMTVPAEAALAANAAAAESGSCSCTDGSCTYDSTYIPLQGTIHYCEGSCAGTCTLAMGIAQGNNFRVEYAFNSYTH